jgi:transposase-like protein
MSSLPNSDELWTPDDARRVLNEWRRSGETLAAFARRHRLTPERLYWWRKRFDREPTNVTTLSLVPATVTPTEVSAPITIRLPNGIGIEAPSASPGWIAAVVAELTRSS